jgi:hypothetical protein
MDIPNYDNRCLKNGYIEKWHMTWVFPANIAAFGTNWAAVREP